MADAWTDIDDADLQANKALKSSVGVAFDKNLEHMKNTIECLEWAALTFRSPDMEDYQR